MVRMKCDFDSTGVLDGVHLTFLLIAIFSFSSFLAAIPYFPIFSGVSFIIFFVSSPAALITSALRGGVIYAVGDKIIIMHRFFNKKVFVSYIRYRDIEYAEYNVKAVHSRIGFIGYDIILTITKKTEGTVKITSGLDIKESMPTDNPDEYKKYLNEHQMVKICRFINERARML
ncbi:MAG: hypothetical protein J1F11_11420 [Oscillospiraceae bacterium]|nr:hypothetical protein [Oscillospiraceae bacterium]